MARHRLARTALAAACLSGGALALPAVQAAIGPGDPPGTFAYVRSTDGGRSFIPMQLHERPPAEDVGISHVEASGGTVHALYENNVENDAGVNARSVLYRRSTDRGTTFAPSVELDRNNGDSGESDLDTVGPTVHVVWEDDKLLANREPDPCCNRPPQAVNRDDVHYSRSTDDGRTFEVPVNLTNSDEVHNRDPDVAVADALVGVSYEARDEISGANSQGNFTNADDVFFRGSSDGGQNWSSEKNLTNQAGNQDEPAIDIAGTTIHVAYRNRGANASQRRIGYVRSTDGGQTFSAPVNLPSPAEGAVTIDVTPGILVQGNLVHVLSCSTDNRLLYWRSSDGGATFAPPAVIASSNEPCNKPVLDGIGSILHVVYEQDVFGESETFYLRSSDGGLTFGPSLNLSQDYESSADPSVSVDPRGGVHVAWNDKTDFLFALDDDQRLPLEEGGRREFDEEDIVRFSGAAYEMVLDGSDVGLDEDIDALAEIPPTVSGALPSYVLSLTDSERVPGVGRVDDSDLVLFTPSSLGERTAGSFRLYFDGSDIGLTRSDEDVDAAEIEAGDLYLSTRGTFALHGGLSGEDEDVFSCDAHVSGPPSACAATSMRFEGSVAGLEQSGEDIDAFSFNGTGNDPDGGAAFFSTLRSFSVATATGDRSDLVRCAFEENPQTTFADCGSAASPLLSVFPGSPHAIRENITALELEF